ncbi:MAG: glutathione S-transferase family protein [Betaproteobacteria bacterium]|nr:glutathione S-transferase family protein [Betaproteobacteria bacterium]
MKLTLYYAPITCSVVPLISLYEAGADFEVKPVNLRKAEQMSPEYLRLNPKHKVPVLLIEGEPLTENVAMALWMTRAFPRAGILPADSDAEVKAISIMAWCASGIHPNLTRINSPAKFCDTPGSEESIKRLAAKELDHVFAIAEGMLAGREYFFDKWCAADSHVFWAWRRAIQFGLDFSKHRHCAAHYERMQRRPAVIKALDFEKQVQAQFAQSA